MPVSELRSYRVRCDGCNENGGEWHGKTSRLEAKPEGWMFVEWDKAKDDGHAIYCPNCAINRGYVVDDDGESETNT